MSTITACKTLAPAGPALDTESPAFAPLSAGWKIPEGWEYTGEFRQPCEGECFADKNGEVRKLVRDGQGFGRYPIIRRKPEEAEPKSRWFRNGDSDRTVFKWDGKEVKQIHCDGTSHSSRHTLAECEISAQRFPNLYGELTEAEALALVAPKPVLPAPAKTRGEEVADKFIFGGGTTFEGKPCADCLGMLVVHAGHLSIPELVTRMKSNFASLINSECAEVAKEAGDAGYALGFRQGQARMRDWAIKMLETHFIYTAANLVRTISIKDPIAKKENA